jgi:hypothetical protein
MGFDGRLTVGIVPSVCKFQNSRLRSAAEEVAPNSVQQHILALINMLNAYSKYSFP